MSLTFSQIIERIDRYCKSNSSSYTLAQKTADVNNALDKALEIIFRAGGTWQFDDGNHTDYPIITTNLVSGQRDYAFSNDGSGNLILDIYKVLVADTNGVYREVTPVDVQSQRDTTGFTDGLNTGGVPTTYDKTANGFFLDAVPNYTVTDGIKVYINREGSYFTTSDTTKKPGFAGLFHNYLAVEPSYQFAMINGLKNKQDLEKEMLRLETNLGRHYTKRDRHVRTGIRVNVEQTR